VVFSRANPLKASRTTPQASSHEEDHHPNDSTNDNAGKNAKYNLQIVDKVIEMVFLKHETAEMTLAGIQAVKCF
jgi:hypothetical protein